MGSVPTTVNKPLQTAETILNTGVMKIGEPLAIQFICSIPQMAWLRTPGIYQIFSYFMGLAGQAFSVALQQMAVRIVISIQTDAERTAYGKAELALRVALQSGDPNAIQKATADAHAAIDSLIHYDGSSPVVR